MDTPPPPPTSPHPAPPPPSDAERRDRNVTTIVYVLYALSFFAGVSLLIGVVVAYVKRQDVGGVYRSHMEYLIRTFWWTLGLGVVGAITTFIGVGVLILLGVYVWLVVRLILGFMKLHDGRPVE